MSKIGLIKPERIVWFAFAIFLIYFVIDEVGDHYDKTTGTKVLKYEIELRDHRIEILEDSVSYYRTEFDTINQMIERYEKDSSDIRRPDDLVDWILSRYVED